MTSELPSDLLLKSNDSHNLGTIGGFGIEREKRQNRKDLIIDKLKGLPGRIKTDELCLMRTRCGIFRPREDKKVSRSVGNWQLARGREEVRWSEVIERAVIGH